MAGPTSANYIFLPWVRQGAAAGIATPDSLGTAAQAGVVSVPVALHVNTTEEIDQAVRLYGPGDVTGINPQQVVRVEPRRLATDFEPNYFPAIEFDRPDLPWLFTPAKANTDGKLRPWLCLVVVRKQDGVTLSSDGPLPVLGIGAPAVPQNELPDLSESWAWAHAQITGSQRDAGSLQQALGGDPALTVSRLVGARRLDPLTDYLACVVPAFDLGRKAGLGQAITPDDEKALKPAWDSAAQTVTLPVYYNWAFRTGVGGDFETLVRLLKAREIPEEAGKLPIDISQPGFPVTPTPAAGATIELQAALRVTDTPEPWPDSAQAPFQTAIQPILNAPAKALAVAGSDPLLAPPIYGSWLAARQTVNIPPAPGTWLEDLNLDPRNRAAAALGTQVIQAQQEALMAAAWEQLGDIHRVNQMRRQMQLARAVNGVYHVKHFSRFNEETLLKVTAPAQSRVVVQNTGGGATRALLLRRIADSPVPNTAVSATLRRITSPSSAISTRFQSPGSLSSSILTKINSGAMTPVPPPPAGPVTIDQVSDHDTVAGLKQAVRFETAAQALGNGPKLGRFKISAEGDVNGALTPLLPLITGVSPVGLPDNADAQAFRNAALAHVQYVSSFAPPIALHLPPMELTQTRLQVLATLNPAATIPARLQASLSVSGTAPPQADPLQPVMDAPSFPQPMYEALRDLSQDWLFPGLDAILPNTVTLLQTNPSFIEAFLMGLNTEMAHELLWRGYPTDQRGTYFRQFWAPVGDQPPDIDLITNWGTTALGEHLHAGEQMVLLVRGELLRRYPNSVIYAVKAVMHNGQLDLSANPNDELHPLFRGTLDPDVTFLGFNLKKAEAIGNPGWFFVIQEQPTEARFGLDAADFTQPLPPLTSWNDLSWRHFANTPEALSALAYAPAKAVLPVIDNATWGRNGSHQACITLQRPVRIAIHASEMIPS